MRVAEPSRVERVTKTLSPLALAAASLGRVKGA